MRSGEKLGSRARPHPAMLYNIFWTSSTASPSAASRHPRNERRRRRAHRAAGDPAPRRAALARRADCSKQARQVGEHHGVAAISSRSLRLLASCSIRRTSKCGLMLQTFRTNSRSDIRLLSSAAERATYTRVLAISRSRADLPPNSCTHRGDFYHVAGPLNVPRCPQGWPVLVQAGSKRLAAAEGRLADPLPAGIYSGGISPSLAEVAPRCRYAAPDGCAGRSVDRRRRCAVTIPASATRPVHGTSRDEWWPRSSGTPASFVRASASWSPTWRGRLSASLPSTTTGDRIVAQRD